MVLTALSQGEGNGSSDDAAAALSVVRFSGTDALSAPLALDIEFESTDADLDAATVLDTGVQLTVYRDGATVRTFDGIVTLFERGITGARRTRYRVIMRPSMWRLSLTQNSRIFQQNDPRGIITTLLSDAGVTQVRFDVARQLELREYCVQYRETDLHFVERLAAEEGLVYYHDYAMGEAGTSHTLVFTDDLGSLPSLGRFEINVKSGGQGSAPYVYAFNAGQRLATTTVVLKDYTFRKPDYSLQFLAEHDATTHGTFEHFDYPGRFKKDASGTPFTQARLDYLQRDAETATARSSIAALSSGRRLQLDGDEAAGDGSFAVIDVHHDGQQDQATAEDAVGHHQSQGTRYNNTATLVPASRRWAATPITKPLVTGPQIAVVVGEEGEEIDCDEFGRVRVLFPWDRETQASAYLRVAQGWAGPGYGMMALPRIGHEVIVTFLEGDPDQPIITGRTYNAESTPPYALPDHKTRSVVRTKTHQGEGYNELQFEDRQGNEHIYVHTQRNLETVTLNDRTEQINNDATRYVKADRFTSIGADEHHTVKGERREHVQGNTSLTVDGTLHIKAGKAWLTKAGREIHVKAGQNVVIDAGTELTIEAGGSFIKLDPSGVTMSGPTIKLNSGGSAASGSDQAAEAPTAPKKPQQM
nr:type VI secretion system tip protein TssI/VgrG [Larsenimonas suaedae]